MQELRQASVAIPFYRDEKGNLRLVLIKRSNYGQHGSQISLPGGNREPQDEGAWDTALRETIEELGLSTKQIVLLSQLEPIDTHVTRYRVSPFVVQLQGITPSFVWKPQMAEVEEVVDVPVNVLASETAAGEEELCFPGWNTRRKVPVRRFQGHTVWGLTLRILEPVLPQALAGKWPIS
ncbi:NUDIX hydrolase (plasmid) [Paenarthrobacter ureafaciens]|jgi:8-oxo-dGTP pyrophosphatase MutT (NUDIX family)|uniref:NUDIX hydrolase n=1 Tax=Micrococcaceae TaxID=1268 RepID=UPI00145F5842|nr:MULTISPECIES: CoA pyrophosphatase [Micrococcaceae]MCW3768884.1 CoA pyrophosphatase [Paenarthrobacter sp. PAE-2]WJH26816.1 CoA pyrophosphatase [Pseudarthrobacter defluvii]